MLKILVTDPISEQGLQELYSSGEFEIIEKIGISPADLLQTIGDFDALLVRSQTKVTKEVIDAGKRLRVIGRAGVGVDNIDVRAATKAGILVINAPDGNTITTAEFTFSMMLALARHIPQAHASLHEGKWERTRFTGVELRGKTLGIVGFGRIGTEVAKRAQAFGMQVIAYDPFLTSARAEKMGVQVATLEETIQVADFITVHTPLTKETRHLISDREFSVMKRGVKILNCARGGIIDEAALLRALEEGIVAGAALDVYEEEPAIANPLLSYAQVIATPHLGASTVEAQVNVAVDVAGGLVKILRGESYPHTVNLPALTPETRKKVEPFVQLGEILGSMAAQTIRGGVQQVQIRYEGEPAQQPADAMTRSILKGVLSHFYREEVHLISATLIAEEMGVEVIETKQPRHGTYANLIEVRLSGDQGTVAVAGTVVPGHGMRIVQIDQYSVDIAPSEAMVLTWHRDQPGVIGHVGGILGEAGVNIASMQVGRQEAGGQAIMMLGVDREVDEAHLKKIRDTIGMDRVLYVELPTS
ncbi:phosphoglycerate dehydrogenase [Sulfoacidibacillus thermotolerans]|uniref:D-3-phosphoglycerate dehydrogenase n=1 Tax=Sulfoacidibacillus thermotolerans TaxID=1765684 RepID=A0A2U3DCN2_SULT2|nr:phosphoglycerate dehydrogenase [Sulfoacidibacillus thermotolerans]PWI59036.1 phosphoglycerate dehydrogenase [Sulfoacidibacillus thermotolerans]